MEHTGFRAILFAGFLLFFNQNIFAQADGYMSSLSITQGEKFHFYISTPDPKFNLNIYKLGLQKKEIIILHDLPGGIQQTDDSAFINGCNWKETTELTIPLTWSSGVYEADIPSADTVKKLLFVVKEKELGSHSKTLVCLSTNTWQAYNNWGGRSLYDFNSYSQTASLKVSFNRPFSDTATANYFRWADLLIKWLEANHFDAEFCVNTDLDNDPFYLSHYKVYVTVGHDEYWSKPERNSVEGLLQSGGRIICLSGNTCWWQVRFEHNLRTMVCYRDTTRDPVYPLQDSIVTGVWGRSPVNDPPNSFLGVSFEHGGFINDDGIFPQFLGYGGYAVFNSNHWVYDGTGIKDGDVIGAERAIAGYESDGALFSWDRGFPVVTGEDKTPTNFSILGISVAASAGNLPYGHATMGYFTAPNSGAVFNGGSTDWVYGLDEGDSVQSQMLLNIFRRFTSSLDLPPEIVDFSPVRVTKDSINHEWMNINHRSMRISAQTTDTFQIRGVDPMGKKLFYNWILDDKTIGFDSILVLTPDMKRNYPSHFLLTGSAKTKGTSAEVSWALIDTGIRFVSQPRATPYLRRSDYFYQAEAASLVDEHPKYSLSYGPSWLHIDSKGILRGIVDDHIGDQTVILRAADSKGNYDYQTYAIHVSDSVENVAPFSINKAALQCFPNPIFDVAHFIFTLKETATVEIDITDMKDKHIRKIIVDGILNGQHFIDWNRLDDNGERVTPGIYCCRMKVSSPSGNQYVITKIAVL